MGVYAFADVRAAIAGPGGTFPFGAGTGVAEEGITIEMTDDKNTLTMGVDGTGQHNLHSARNGTITVRLLKTSPQNALMQKKYDLETSSAAFHGQSTISVYNLVSGDNVIAQSCAFKKFPNIAFTKDGPMMEWAFDCIVVTAELGSAGPVFS